MVAVEGDGEPAEVGGQRQDECDTAVVGDEADAESVVFELQRDELVQVDECLGHLVPPRMRGAMTFSTAGM